MLLPTMYREKDMNDIYEVMDKLEEGLIADADLNMEEGVSWWILLKTI